jgi:hypothetical protein
MAEDSRAFILKAMNVSKLAVLMCLAWLFCERDAGAQTEFKFTFRGLSYQTNGSGNIVVTPLTEQSLLEEVARDAGITSVSNLTLAYRLRGSEFGDTVDVINRSNGASLDWVFGFYFGEDTALGRMALTNATRTEQRRVDYIYTKQNSHSMGAAFVTKRFLTDTNGNVHTTIEGPMQWIVLPQGTNTMKVRTGNFTVGPPLF